MQTLRRARFLARLVLAWFAVALGVAVAAPLVQPQSVELICSGGGAVKLIVKGDDGGAAPVGHVLDCPLCAAVAPPPPWAQRMPTLQPLGHISQPIPAARRAAPAGAPLPARGPPRVHTLAT